MQKAAEVTKLSDKKLVGNINEKIADLETAIKGINYPLTIAINGEWGAGKTVFLKEWSKQKPENSIYIDAFATDFLDNPLAVVLSEFTNYFKNEKLFEKLSEKKIDFENVTKNGFTEIIKALTNSLIDLNKLIKEDPLNQGIDDLRKINNAVVEFKRVVSNIQSGEGKQKLYVFVDELDRCKPTYAVEFIEIVKHFFEIDNTVFIFAINRKELISSIKHVQGCADEDRYLKKFFNLNFDLPQLPTKDFIELIAQDEEKTLGLDKAYFDEEFVRIFTLYSNGFYLQPRDIEQVFSKIVLALKKHDNINAKSFMHPLIILAILKHSRETRENYYDKLFEGGSGKPHTLIDRMDIGNKYLKDISEIDKYKFEKWLELIRLDKKSMSDSVRKELDDMDDDADYAYVNERVYPREESIFFNEKLVFLKGINTNGFYFIQDKIKIIQYIEELLNFSNQFSTTKTEENKKLEIA